MPLRFDYIRAAENPVAQLTNRLLHRGKVAQLLPDLEERFGVPGRSQYKVHLLRRYAQRFLTVNVNNGQPGTLARWIDALDLKAGERVFHLGCGVGYYTAVIAEVVGSDGGVVASEVDADLAARARENLTDYPNVTVHPGDGAAFDPGTCDAMLINAGVTHPLPLWLDRLSEGGRIMLPLTVAMGANLGKGVVVKIIRERSGFSAQVITFVAIFSCIGARNPQLEPLLGKALATGTLMKLKSVRRDPHEQDDTCVVHGDACLSSIDS
jgi:protein-L-isoaspartate(D-aspartate) O-methyltransferase